MLLPSGNRTSLLRFPCVVVTMWLAVLVGCSSSGSSVTGTTVSVALSGPTTVTRAGFSLKFRNFSRS